jgi:hypothetical protein
MSSRIKCNACSVVAKMIALFVIEHGLRFLPRITPSWAEPDIGRVHSCTLVDSQSSLEFGSRQVFVLLHVSQQHQLSTNIH